MKTTAGALTRDHLGGEVVIRMGKDRIAGIVNTLVHRGESVEVVVGMERGWQACVIDPTDVVEVPDA